MKRRRFLPLAVFVVSALAVLGVCGTGLFQHLQPDGRVESLPPKTSSSWTDADYERECGCPGKVLRDDRGMGGGYEKEWRDPNDFYLRVSFDKDGHQWRQRDGDRSPTNLARTYPSLAGDVGFGWVLAKTERAASSGWCQDPSGDVLSSVSQKGLLEGTLRPPVGRCGKMVGRDCWPADAPARTKSSVAGASG